MGATPLVEAFFVALKLPNFFRRFFAEGAFNAAFIPIFSKRLENKGKEQALSFASQIFSMLIFVLLFITILFEIFMPSVILFLAPGFDQSSEIYLLTVDLARVTFPYLMFISIATLFAAILNSISAFGAVAFMPVLFNLSLISALIYLPEFTKTEAHALAWGVFIAGILQVIWMIFNLYKKGFLFLPSVNYFKGKIRDIKFFLKKFFPGAIGAGVTQINLWVDLVIATYFSGAVAFLYYADRVNQLPLSIIGTAMGTALLPSLSRNIAKGDDESKNKNFNDSILIVLLLTIPASLALLFISENIIAVLFERGEFSSSATYASSLALKAYALGLPAFALIKIFATCFFAMSDTKTPVISAIYALIFNVVLNILLVILFQNLGYMPHIGLALATSISGWINALYLLFKLKKGRQFIIKDNTNIEIMKILFSSSIMVVFLLICSNFELSKYMLLLLLVFGGLACYFISVKLLRISIFETFIFKIKKRF
jgi:putative peptidoglycan lipid II flippase